MKFIYITILTTLMCNGLFAQQKKIIEDTITVYGNCIMCQRRIEAALDLPGIKATNWNYETKKLFIAYNPKKISEDKIHHEIAAVGHDTNRVSAPDSVYAKLAFCCLYREHDPHNAEDHAKEKKKHSHQ